MRRKSKETKTELKYITIYNFLGGKTENTITAIVQIPKKLSTMLLKVINEIKQW